MAVPWRLLTDAGHSVVFATESGAAPTADPLLPTGVPLGQLGAEPEPIAFYRPMIPARQAPLPWAALEVGGYDALLLPGGHAPGMRQHLGSTVLPDKLRQFRALERPVAAICHGVLPLARAGVLDGVRTTCLPKDLERSAFALTAWRRGRYYRTYPAYVEDEVRAAGAVFERDPLPSTPFLVREGRDRSARRPTDAYLFARGRLQLWG